MTVHVNKWYKYRTPSILSEADYEFTRLSKLDRSTDGEFTVFNLEGDLGFVNELSFTNVKIDDLPMLVQKKKLEKLLNSPKFDEVYSPEDIYLDFFNLWRRRSFLNTTIFFLLLSNLISGVEAEEEEVFDYFNVLDKCDYLFNIVDSIGASKSIGFEVAPLDLDFRISLTLTKSKKSHASLGRSFGAFFYNYRELLSLSIEEK